MGPIGHALISAPLAAGVWICTRDPAAAAATFIAGTCIDIDHLVDYTRARGLRMDLRAIRTGSYFEETGQAIVPLHSYELILLLTLWGWHSWSRAIAFGVFLGASSHLLTDLAFYRFRPLCYSFLYRSRARFALGSFRLPGNVEGDTGNA